MSLGFMQDTANSEDMKRYFKFHKAFPVGNVSAFDINMNGDFISIVFKGDDFFIV